MNNLTFIANWKMSFSFEQTIVFTKNNYNELTNLARNHTIVLCPTFIALENMSTAFKNTNIKIGAQDCSSNKNGAFTGQVSAESIKQVGASFCIIGHSERRRYNHETNEIIAQKFIRLREQNITPIICIGETLEDYNNNKTIEVLEKQLQEILEILKNQEKTEQNEIFIAYEPVWSIGTGLVPDNNYLERIFTWLAQKTGSSICHPELVSGSSLIYKLLYGGSVKSDNVKTLAQIQHLSGFLIGGASLDFQELKKIVECNDERYSS